MTDEAKALVEQISDEADLCRNDGAGDIADLLDETKALIETQAREIERLRQLIKWVKYCDGLGTFRKTDCREVVISFEDSEAGMTFFERMSDFIDDARAALAGDSHD